MITPVEVLGKELKKGFGYKANEVDAFLEKMAKDFENIYKENSELKEKVGALTENLNHYRTIEDSMKKTLVMAEETSKETVESAEQSAQNTRSEARNKATTMIQNAEIKAKQIKAEAEEESTRIRQECARDVDTYKKMIHKLESDYNSYKAKMRGLLTSHLELLDDPSFEISFDIDNKVKEVQDAPQGEQYEQFAKEHNDGSQEQQ